MNKKTTDKDFKLFKTECQKWIDKFELNEWKVYYKHQSLKKSVFAEINSNLHGRVTIITLEKDWPMEGIESIEDSIKEVAKHEVIHLLLVQLCSNAQTRYVNKDQVDEAEEALVRKLEKLL